MGNGLPQQLLIDGLCGEVDHGFAKLGVGARGDHDGVAEEGAKEALHFLYLYLDAPGADDVVQTAEDAEMARISVLGFAALFVKEFHDVARVENVGMEVWSIDDEAIVLVLGNRYAGQWLVPQGGVLSADRAQRNVGEGFCHAVGAPDVVGKVSQYGFHLWVDGSTSDEEMADVPQPFPFEGYSERFVDLKGYEGCKVHWLFHVLERVAGGCPADESQAPDFGSHFHHSPCDVVGGEAEESGVARSEVEEVAGHGGGGSHTALFHPNFLGLACAAAGVELLSLSLYRLFLIRDSA